MILLIDDDSYALRSYIIQLERKDFKVKIANSPQSALEKIEKYKKDLKLIILDLMMPTDDLFGFEESNGGMNTGYALLKIIRIKMPNIPVFIFTIRSDHDLDKQLLKEKVVKILRKPDTLPFELLNEVEKAGIIPNSIS
jgi:CheY-like chemotaxis protein